MDLHLYFQEPFRVLSSLAKSDGVLMLSLVHMLSKEFLELIEARLVPVHVCTFRSKHL